MRNKIFLIVIIIISSYVGYIFISTGFFKSIDNNFDGKILKKINVQGAEDITVNHIDSFAIISSTHRKKFPATEQEYGGLYFLDLKNLDKNPVLLTRDFKKPFAPHGISIYSQNNETTIAAINHTYEGEFIELFKLIENKAIHYKTLKNKLIYSPNDIVLVDEESFYFTNDHGYKEGFPRLVEDYLGLPFSNVVYYNSKTNFIEVASNISYANGINYDSKRKLIFVASPRKFEILVYERKYDNSLKFIENISCGTGVDNIEFDLNGDLWVGAHPNLLHFNSYIDGKNKISPSEIINIKYKTKQNHIVNQIYIEEGNEMSGSTVAAPFGNLILVGNVKDNHFLVLKKTD